MTPAVSRTVKPGAAPSFFARMTVSLPGAGPSPVTAPRITSPMVSGLVRMRLVNQLESGTSSMVLMLPRGCPAAARAA